VRLTLVEREPRLGGKIVTERDRGFVVEGGADSFLSRKPRGIGLCEELGISSRLQGRRREYENTYVLHKHRLHRLPEGLTGMVPTNLNALRESTLISAEGRARLEQEYDLPPAPGDRDESVATFVARRLGQEVFEQLVEPLMGGIYAGDAGQLSLAATFPQLRALEQRHGSLLKGLHSPQGSKEAEISPYPPFVALRSGMVELIESVTDRLTGSTLITGSGVATVERASEGYELMLENRQTLHASALILCTPAFATAELLEPWAPNLAAIHRQIPYASVATISFAYNLGDIDHPLDGYGYLIPRVEGGAILACTWSSRKWDGRAPEGAVLLRLYLGRYGQRDTTTGSDEDLFALAQDEVHHTLGISTPPALRWLFRWPRSMPQYTMGHMERLSEIARQRDAFPGLFLAGAAYRGIGIPDCIRSGEQAAEETAAYLGQRVYESKRPG
jgi:oxygen-dependent protoporphyrinogen oxidase